MLRQLPLHSVLAQQVAVGVLGVVLEQAHGPGRAEASLVRAVGGGRRGPAVGGGAPGGVGDVHPVSEQLCHQLDIGRLAAAGAGAGELEVGLGKLGGLHILVADGVVLDLHRLHAVGPVLRLLDLALQRPHGQGCLLGQAHIHAAAAAGAVVGGDLDPVGVLPVHASCGHRLEARRLARLPPSRPAGWAGWRRGDTPESTGCTGCTWRRPTPGPPPLRPASHTWRCPRGQVPSSRPYPDHGGHRQHVALLAVHHRHHILDEGGIRAVRRLILGVQPALPGSLPREAR